MNRFLMDAVAGLIVVIFLIALKSATDGKEK